MRWLHRVTNVNPAHLFLPLIVFKRGHAQQGSEGGGHLVKDKECASADDQHNQRWFREEGRAKYDQMANPKTMGFEALQASKPMAR